MNIKYLARTFGLANAFCVAATSLAAAYIEPVDRPTCYLSIHNQCYGGGENNCTEEDYNEALDECDTMFGEGSQAIDPKRLIQSLKTKQKKRSNTLQLQ